MTKYIDADKLLDIIIKKQKEYATQEVAENHKGLKAVLGGQCIVLTEIIKIIDSLQQDEIQVDKQLCSKIWWEEQGWIMIPPDVTIEGIDSLLKQVRKKLQQEQPEVDLEKEIDSFFPESYFENAINFDNAIDIARHFYELGLKARNA